MVLALLLAVTVACKDDVTTASDSNDNSSASVVSADTKICGTPPCVHYVTRSDTRDLDTAVNKHPIASVVTVHLALTVLCGGLLCLLGEGASLTYVQHQTRAAAENHECLVVQILPKGHGWQLVRLSASNQQPYCKD